MPLVDLSGRPVSTAPAAGATPSGANPHVKDSNIQTFAADVLQASLEVPVVVDFWAPWCGPCKTLGPMLEKAVADAKGAVKMVKVNIDENPEIAQQLRIQSIPTVYAFRNGQPVDGFMGAIPESQIKLFIQNLIGGAAPQETDIAGALDIAGEAFAGGDIAGAAQIFGQVLQEEPGHPKAVAGLAKCYLVSGDLERAKATLGLVRPDGAGDEAIRAVEAELALKEKAAATGSPEIAGLEAKLAANPADHEARYNLALALDTAGDREGAINHLLDIIRRDRKWNEDAARKHLLTLFDAMGPMDPRTMDARRRLSTILFS